MARTRESRKHSQKTVFSELHKKCRFLVTEGEMLTFIFRKFGSGLSLLLFSTGLVKTFVI